MANSVGSLLNVIRFKTVPESAQVDIFSSQIFLLFLSPLTPCQLRDSFVPRGKRAGEQRVQGCFAARGCWPGQALPALRPRPGLGCRTAGRRWAVMGLGWGIHRQPAAERAASVLPACGRLFPGIRASLCKVQLSKSPHKL